MKRTVFISSAATAAAVLALPVAARAAEETSLVNAGATLFGTLDGPSTAEKVPLVLLISGSGPTDRDGNVPVLHGKNDALKLIAASLASRGIASLRYDKRGIGASAATSGAASDLRFDTYVGDAVAWIAALRAKNRFSRVVVAGHSEGSLVGMIAAVRAAADGFISLEGLGRPAAQVLREQFRRQAPSLAPQVERIIDEISAGRIAVGVPPELASALRPSVQPYLTSWFKYDPTHEIAAVRSPVAIVQGTADIQVTREDGDLLHAALPSAAYVVVEAMNHVLKHAPDQSSKAAVLAGYTDPALPVVPEVIDAIARIATG